MNNKTFRGVALVLALGLAVLTGTYIGPLAGSSKPNVFAAPSAALTGTGVYAIADVAESASPSVVYIEVEYKASAYSRSGSSFFDAFSPWFSQEPESSTGAIAQGSGFIISSDGQIVTNQHVVDNDTQIKEIRVHVLNHKEPYTAKLLAKDYKTDLAVLKIEPDSKLAVATLGDSDKSRVGEWVVAIGNPYGQEFDHTVTQGVLSAKGRQITIYDSENNTDRDYTNLMQTDAAINPGNSGGPLLNLQGEVIGINTAVQASGQGIGFAIPINVAKNVVQELISKGKVVRPWLGIEYGSFTEDMADYLGLTSTKGVLVSSVFRDSPASKGGLQPGDVIRKVNGQAVDDADAFAKAIGDMKIGTKLTFILDRSDGRSVRSVTVTVTVGERPDDV